MRYLSNASTGRMGFEIARDALRRGAQVVLIHGPCALRPPTGAEAVVVDSTHDLMLATEKAVRGADLVVFAAAPADFRPAIRVHGKIKKRRHGGPHRLALVQTADVAATVGWRKGRRIHVGFALKVEDSFANALGKMAAKSFDALVLNGPGNVGRGGGHAWFLTPDAAPRPFRPATSAGWRAQSSTASGPPGR